MLIAPLLLAVLWLLFFLAGAQRHRQDVIVVARSGAWNHMRVYGENFHRHDVDVDPAYYPDLLTWTGDTTADWFITSNYHLPADTNPEVTPLNQNRYAPYSLADWRFNAGQSTDPYGAEHWVLSAQFEGRTSNVVGQSIERTVTSRLKTDAGCWTWRMHDWRRHVDGEPAARSQNVAVNGAADTMVSQLLVQARVAQQFRALSVMR